MRSYNKDWSWNKLTSSEKRAYYEKEEEYSRKYYGGGSIDTADQRRIYNEVKSNRGLFF